jgi:hypothetical protein
MSAYLKVKDVKPTDDYKLILTFSNREKRIFDVKPYLNKGIFKELKDIAMFNTAHVSFDTVEWDNEADIDPEVLYNNSKKYPEKSYGKRVAVSAAAESKTKYRRK